VIAFVAEVPWQRFVGAFLPRKVDQSLHPKQSKREGRPW